MLILFLSFYPPKYLNLFCNGYREESDKKTVALTQLDADKFVGFFLIYFNLHALRPVGQFTLLHLET